MPFSPKQKQKRTINVVHDAMLTMKNPKQVTVVSSSRKEKFNTKIKHITLQIAKDPSG